MRKRDEKAAFKAAKAPVQIIPSRDVARRQGSAAAEDVVASESP